MAPVVPRPKDGAAGTVDEDVAATAAAATTPTPTTTENAADPKAEFAAGAGAGAGTSSTSPPKKKRRRRRDMAPPVVHPGVTCDGTGTQPLSGVRFHKMGVDYDLCAKAFDKLDAAEQRLYEVITAPGVAAVPHPAWIAMPDDADDDDGDGDGEVGEDEELSEEDLVGVYKREPQENGWHTGVVSFKPGTRALQWTNLAGKSWNIYLDMPNKRIHTDSTNPYFDTAQDYAIHFRGGRLFGFVFGFDFFVADGVVAIPQAIGGLKGYISVHVDPDIPEDFGYGVSFYTRIWNLLDRPLAAFQIGLPSTWICPDNRKFCEPVCAPGTVARDNWERTRGKDYFRNVFQTLEGGLGYWCSTQFGSAVPKYRINGTPNGYNHEVSSPGYGFGRTTPLVGHEVGIAQLSNRLLIPPDGFTFDGECNGLLGNAWMALPWMQKRGGPSRHDATSFMSIPVVSRGNPPAPGAPGRPDRPTPTGEMCWTLFLNAANFAGPVAFYIPDLWSHDATRYPTIVGRTLDARPGNVHGGAMEINTVPYFQGRPADDGHSYTRIPKLSFPVDDDGMTVLLRDMVMYSAGALFAETKRWLDGGAGAGDVPSGAFGQGDTAFVTSLTLKPQVLKQGPENRLLSNMESKFVPAVVSDGDDSHAFVLKWKDGGDATCPHKPGKAMFPEYYKVDGDTMVPVDKGDVPVETELADQEFLQYDFRAAYEEAPGYVDPAAAAAVPPPQGGPHEARLQDGSTVAYGWYRFIDQPSLRAVKWSAGERETLQRAVERLHREWTDDKTYMPPPGKGELVGLDPALLMTPPPGMELGYVPVAYAQNPTPAADRAAATAGAGATTTDAAAKPGPEPAQAGSGPPAAGEGWTEKRNAEGRRFWTRLGKNKAGLTVTTYDDPTKKA